MERREYRVAMDSVTLSESRREAILAAEAPRKRANRHPKWPVLVAAALAAALLTVGAVAVGNGQSIGEIFSDYWSVWTESGVDMGGEQLRFFEELSQPVGENCTVDGVTVIVDSAMVGDDTFCLLLRVQGMKFAPQREYGFSDYRMKLYPEDTGGASFHPLLYRGTDESGTARFLWMKRQMLPLMPDGRPLTVELTITDLVQYNGGKIKTRQEGTWEFRFELSRGTVQQTLRLGDADVVKNIGEGPVTAHLTDIEVTNFTLRFCTAGEDFTRYGWPAVVLKDGTEVDVHLGLGTPDDYGGRNSFQLEYPLDLEQVAAVRFGETTISVR